MRYTRRAFTATFVDLPLCKVLAKRRCAATRGLRGPHTREMVLFCGFVQRWRQVANAALPSGAKGRRFDSCRAHHRKPCLRRAFVCPGHQCGGISRRGAIIAGIHRRAGDKQPAYRSGGPASRDLQRRRVDGVRVGTEQFARRPPDVRSRSFGAVDSKP